MVSLCLGSVAGLGAARVVTSHYSMMVQGHEPALRRRAAVVVNQLGIETVDKETLGGQRHPHAQRRGRRRGRDRGRGVRPRPPRSSRTSRARSTSCRRAPSPTDDPERARRPRCSTRSPASGGKVYKVRSIIDAVVDRGLVPRDRRGAGAAPRSPGSRGSTAGRSRCSPTTRTTTPAAGPPTRRARSSASSTSPRRSGCRSCTSSTTRAS